MGEVCFKVGNDLIERCIYVENGVPVRSVLRNLKSGMEWATDGREAVIRLPGIDLAGSEVTLYREESMQPAEIMRTAEVTQSAGVRQSQDSLRDSCVQRSTICFRGVDFEVRWEFRIWKDLAVIESRIGVKGMSRKAAGETEGAEHDAQVMQGGGIDKDYIDGCGCSSRHVALTVVEFHDCSDETDHLVEERQLPLYQKGSAGYDGHIFLLREEVSGEECLWVKNAPCEVAQFHKNEADFRKNALGNMHLCGSGLDLSELSEEEYVYAYPVAVGVSEKGGGMELFRQYYEKDYSVKTPYIMSNTWGDRNCDKCVSEEFILKEIETAARLGCDVVQIDDGWQQGITANSLLASGGAWTGKFRLADSDFWQVNRKKFPNGFGKIAEAAKAHRVELGLWFSPDSEQDYADWELDAEVMIDFYRQYGIRYFKIDGVVICNQDCVKHLCNMFEKVRKASGGNVIFNMDITAGKRFGYLFHKEIGDIFVENRYTDFGNYYPHNTLRNLWELAHYLPAQRLQMEVLNHKRNPEKYDDILAPAGFDIDYLFASVMVANPLLWMEMSSLDEVSKERLSRLIRVYKKYREDFVKVTPILEKPSGFSLTGFLCEGRENNYVILLRELAEGEEFPYSVKEILATNDPILQDKLLHSAGTQESKNAAVKLTRKRSYLFGILA